MHQVEHHELDQRCDKCPKGALPCLQRVRQFSTSGEPTMLRTAARCRVAACFLLVACVTEVSAQKAPYDVFPPARAPYYRVRYEGSGKQGELIFGVNYTVWIPPGVKTLRGV